MTHTFKAIGKELKLISKTPQLSQAFLISIFLFFIYYVLFYLFYNPIHNFYPSADAKTLLWWQQGAFARDGLEWPVMLVGSFIYSIFGYLILTKIAPKLWFSKRFVKLGILLVFLFFLTQVRSDIFNYYPIWQAILLTSLVASLMYLCFRIIGSSVYTKYSLLFKILIWSLLGLFILFAADMPSIFDYDAYIGPALKLSQGDKLGSFYMQYDVLLTYFFKVLMELKLEMYQIKFIIELIFIAWFFLYYLISKKFIDSSALRLLFMIALFVTRYLANYFDPTALAQQTPMRLDLWVILLLITSRFGFRSPITAASFSLVYILNNVFGLLYLAVYLLALLVDLFWNTKRKLKANFLLILLPIIGSVIFQYYFFKSWTSPAVAAFQKLQFGFVPISRSSSFWIFFATIPLSIFVFSKEKNLPKVKLLFFVLGLALVQLTYFYGRSHDANLISISGLLLFIIFLLLGRLNKHYRLINLTFNLAVVIILLITFLFSANIFIKLNRAKSNLLTLKILPSNAYNELIYIRPQVSSYYPKNTQILILSVYDSYINYHLGLKQIGDINPFIIRFFVDDTSDFLIDQIKKGVKVVYWEKEMSTTINQLNNSAHLQSLNLRFDYVDRLGFRELKLIARSDIAPSNQLTKYSIDGLSFNYPDNWRVTTSLSQVSITDANAKFNVLISMKKASPKEFNEEINQPNSNNYGKLINQGPAEVFNIPQAYVKFWQNQTQETMQLYLFKEDRVLELTVFPSDSPLIREVNRLIATIDF